MLACMPAWSGWTLHEMLARCQGLTFIVLEYFSRNAFVGLGLRCLFLGFTCPDLWKAVGYRIQLW